MQVKGLAWLAAVAAAAFPSLATAEISAPGITLAAPGSVEDEIGQTILYFVAGRPRDPALGTTGDYNPYQIDGEMLLYSIGAFFVTTTYDGEPVHEGELSLFPQFVTPLGVHEASAATPGIIPFALVRDGVCHAGLVAGHPVPDTTYSVDLSDQPCHAAMVEEIVYAAYTAQAPVAVPTEPAGDEPTDTPPVTTSFDPAMPSDVDLDVIVWAAYNAAYDAAMADPEYLFVRNGDFAPVRTAIEAEIDEEGFRGVMVAERPAASAAAAFGCAADGTTELRVALIAEGAGIVLVAASSRRLSSYFYDPAVSSDLDVRSARDCHTEGFGRSHVLNVP